MTENVFHVGKWTVSAAFTIFNPKIRVSMRLEEDMLCIYVNDNRWLVFFEDAGDKLLQFDSEFTGLEDRFISGVKVLDGWIPLPFGWWLDCLPQCTFVLHKRIKMLSGIRPVKKPFIEAIITVTAGV